MSPTTDMNYAAFADELKLSVEDICRDYYRENREAMRIKKERVAIKNLVSIVDAALTLSARVGFDAMSLRDLCRESGLSMGALYAYFSSKDEMLTMMQRQGQLTVMRVLGGMIERHPEPLPRLRAAIRSHLYLSELLHRWFYFFFMETKNLKKKNRTIPIESELFTEKIFTDIIAEGNARGVFRIDQVELTGSVIKAMLQDWYLKRWKYTQRKISIETYADFITRFVESAIGIAGAPDDES